MDDARVCPSCCCKHGRDFKCNPFIKDESSRICTKKCSHNNRPLNRFACKHNDEAPTVSVSKVGSERSIPLLENLDLGHLSLGIQYDTGCQLSLISKSVLQTLPASMYSQGNSTRVRVLSYAGEGKVILTTQIKLKIFGQVLTLSAIDEDLTMFLVSHSPLLANGGRTQVPPTPPTQVRSPFSWVETITSSSRLKKNVTTTELLSLKAKSQATS